MPVQISIGCRFGVEREGVKTQLLCLSERFLFRNE